MKYSFLLAFTLFNQPLFAYTIPAECLKQRMPVLVDDMYGFIDPECFQLWEHRNEHYVVEEEQICFGPELPDRSYYEQCVDFNDTEEFSTAIYYRNTEEAYYNADLNVMQYAAQYLWPIVPDDFGSYGRAPCDSEAYCLTNTQYENECYISTSDCDFSGADLQATQLRTYKVTCDGFRACSWEGKSADECCR